VKGRGVPRRPVRERVPVEGKQRSVSHIRLRGRYLHVRSTPFNGTSSLSGRLAALGQLGRRAPCHIIERSPLPFRTDAQPV
jgi:hypothetical protein